MASPPSKIPKKPAQPHQQLANALKVLKRLQDKHHGVLESADIAPQQWAVLLEAGFLRPVIKGWYLCANPLDKAGDSTVWYASFWAFVSGYLAKRFGKRYCLNPETSLLLHTG
ncbi:MAG: cell filamentation protein Fic, partial [Rhodoferax sp.]|nr:cell filamentation protein Fic [Rhodoferax sp.]